MLQAQAKGSSLMQPLVAPAKPQAPSQAQIGSDAFAAMAESDVAPDAQFFHKYYRYVGFNLTILQDIFGLELHGFLDWTCMAFLDLHGVFTGSAWLSAWQCMTFCL